MRVMGGKCFYKIEKKEGHGKFQPIAYKGVLVGYTMSNSSYRVWNLIRHTIYNVGFLAFDETAKPGWWRASTPRVATSSDNGEVISLNLFPSRAPAPVPVPPSADFDATSTVDPGQETVTSK